MFHSTARRLFAAKRPIAWAAAAVVMGVPTYYMAQDLVYVHDAKGAYERVPFLALHPESGGPKRLPIVSHQLDSNAEADANKPRIVIVGGGWAAVSLLRHLKKDKYNVTVVSDNNYFLFTPLLPSATVGTLLICWRTCRSLVEPIRKIAARINGHFLEAKAIDVDLKDKLLEVQTVDGEGRFYVPYDKLVIAVGAQSITHGVEGLEHTNQLKTIQDALQIRRRVVGNVEKACLPTTTPEERKQLLSFVVCGGGPTGIEFAAELFDWINEDLVKWFPKLLREDVSVSIIQSRDHILNTFDVKISEYAEKRFNREHVNVITNARVQRIEKDAVVFKRKAKDAPEESIKHGLCLWSTGIAMTPFVQNLSDKLGLQNHRRALITDECLRVKGIEDGSIYALGDCATVENPKLSQHIREIFEAADTDKNGAITPEEFIGLTNYIRKVFPSHGQHMNKLVSTFKKYEGTITMEVLEGMLKEVDSKMTLLPATAQVASQQGAYLGTHLNGDEPTKPFIYHHLGSLAYLGNTAVGEFSMGYKMIGGLYALYLWRSIYWSEQVSMRTRMNLSLDWSKRALWGRDISIF
ncbi:hypothetical protein BX666DRAFT_1848999 [Dichotomocladium elegans]|nr:hypothetical protein BX666DRAFT_1848999 [Dichotomocladium elegans]